MSTASASSPVTDPTPTLLTCRAQNQAWAATLNSNEAEIDGLLSLLADLLEQQNSQLQHRAVDYYGSLNQLKDRIEQLRAAHLCSSNACGGVVAPVPCNENQFGNYQTLPPLFSQLRDEIGRMRDTCYQFITGLVKLNLI
ncbi:hypothetical protein [Spirosoma rigui]|uniref:hypothetical protein n=1 Tax=Spirosoma rigui TaxID=564064 RepID=UPI0009B156B5|nr:hypothetical protein [Spirosoma rigui]